MKKHLKNNPNYNIIDIIKDKKYLCVNCDIKLSDIEVIHHAIGVDCITCGYTMDIIYLDYKIYQSQFILPS